MNPYKILFLDFLPSIILTDARWLPVQLAYLGTTLTEIYDKFLQGNSVVQKRCRSFSGISINQIAWAKYRRCWSGFTRGKFFTVTKMDECSLKTPIREFEAGTDAVHARECCGRDLLYYETLTDVFSEFPLVKKLDTCLC